MTLRVDNLSAGYERRPAVHHVSGAFEEGAMTAVVGPNGGGKSTFLAALAGLLKPMSGRVDLGGIARRSIAYLAQSREGGGAFPLSVLDVVCFGFWPTNGAFRAVSHAQRARALRALDAVGMRSFADRTVDAMSVGQMRRVLFGRLMLQDASVLLLDEPFAGIDTRTATALIGILEGWQSEGRTVICVMHDLTMVRSHFPQSLMLARELVAWGPTRDVLTDAHLARAEALSGSWVSDPDACDLPERLSA